MKGLCQAEGALGRSFHICKPFVEKDLLRGQEKKSGGRGVDKQGRGLNHLDLCEAAWEPWLISMAANHFSPMHNPVEPPDS